MHITHVFYCENSIVSLLIFIHKLKNKNFAVRFPSKISNVIPEKYNVDSLNYPISFFSVYFVGFSNFPFLTRVFSP